jgi:Icc protein
MNEDERKIRREIANSLRKPGDRPDPSVSIARRIFLHRSLLAGAAVGAASYGWFPLINTIDIAIAATNKGGQGETIRFAWISDTHLYPKDVNTRFVKKAQRAVHEVKAMDPPADFLIFGGDMAQLGDPLEIAVGSEILKELDIKQVFIPGEHDWYLDLGGLWEKKFGTSPWAFDHKGVRFIGLNTVGSAMDYWTATKMTPKERMGHMATLDGTVAGAWAGLGAEQLKWLQDTLADWPKDKAVVIFSHNPLYEYYPPWNFWVRDWRQVHEIVAPYSKITNLHGHTHQVLYNEIGKMRSIGMLATAWPWPYAPEGVPELTKPMIRADIGDHFDGLGWDKATLVAGAEVEHEYMMWNERGGVVFAEEVYDSGTGDNPTQYTHSRIADRMWPY